MTTMIASNASDRITLNVGGKLFETTKTTLMASDSRFFTALFTTGGTLAANAATSGEANDGSHPVLFIDRDSRTFQDILYFMRTNMIDPQTTSSLAALKRLQTEAEFFAYDELMVACEETMDMMKKSITESLQRPSRKAKAGKAIVKSNNALLRTIEVEEEGMIVYIVSATLAGPCIRIDTVTLVVTPSRLVVPVVSKLPVVTST